MKLNLFVIKNSLEDSIQYYENKIKQDKPTETTLNVFNNYIQEYKEELRKIETLLDEE